MKKNILILASVFMFTSTAFAQNAGQIWVGGNFGYTYQKQEDQQKLISYKILPEVGYAITEKIGVGITGGFEYKEEMPQNYYGSSYQETKSFVVHPFVRYTFLKGDIGGLFVDAGVKYGKGNSEYFYKNYYSSGYLATFIKSDLETNTVEVGFRPGVRINISNKVALTAKCGMLGYSYQKEDEDQMTVTITPYPSSFDGHYYYESTLTTSTRTTKAKSYIADFSLDRLLFGINIVF